MPAVIAHRRRIRALAAASLLAASLLAVGLSAGGAPALAANAATLSPAQHAAGGGPQAAPPGLPLTFQPNDGQAAPDVRYLGQAQGVSVLFTETGVTLDLTRAPAHGVTGASAPHTRVTLAFRQASPQPQITGTGREPGTVNYFGGNNPARWHTGIPAYARVVYHQLWPGIDATFTARDGTLRYWFSLAPGASASEIRLAYTGARHLTIARSGALAITTPAGILRDQAPASTQASAGHQTPIASSYRLTGGTSFGFTVGRRAPGAAVTIDPGLDYLTYLGGSQTEASESIDTDAAGNLYVFGFTSSADFPTTPAAYQGQNPNPDTTYSFFVTKLNPTGTSLIYSTFVTGTGEDIDDHGVVDSSGDAYVTGDIAAGNMGNFPTTAGAYRRTPYLSATQSVVFKLNPSGSQLLYSTYLAPDLGTAGLGHDIGLAPGGSVIVAGDTSSDFAPTTPGAFQPSDPGGNDTGYVARLNAAGSGLIYGTYLGAPVTSQAATVGDGGVAPSCFAEGMNLAVDSHGAVYIAGACTAGFLTTAGAYQTAATDAFDGLLVKLDPAGTHLDYATYYGTPPPTELLGEIVRLDAVAVDSAGDAYVTGDVPAGDVPATPGAYASNCASSPGPGAYCTGIAEFNPSGTGLVYSTYFGANGDELPTIAIDGSGDAYVTGVSSAGDIPTTPGAYQPTPGNFAEAFWLAAFGPGGSHLLYATYLGGAGSVETGGPAGVSGDITMAPEIRNGAIYLGGYTSADSFPVTPGAYQTKYAGGFSDTWAAKFDLPELGG
jgi:hypothetical protein